MLKALLKKQLLEAGALFMGNGRKGKRRSPLFIIGISALILYAFSAMVIMFWLMAETLCLPLVQSGLTWVYFALIGALAFSMSTILLALAAKNTLYEAKDNELLLAMPIKPSAILFVRMLGLYLLALLIVALAFVPGVVYYFTAVGFSVSALLCSLIILFVLPLGAMALAALIGWLIAFITSKIPAKNVMTVVLLLAFLIGYSVLVSEMNNMLGYILMNGEAVAETFQNTLYPLWQMGLAATGNWLSLLAFSSIFITAFALVYVLLSATFFSIITQKRTGKKAKYVKSEGKTRSAFTAILWKEGKRFVKTPMILFNAGLGSMIAIVFAIYALVSPELCAQIANAPIDKGVVASIVTVIVAFIATTNVITGSSVSLEGENLWILRSMPIDTLEIFKAKIAFHFLYTALPVSISLITICALLSIPFLTVAFAIATTLAVTVLCAVMGLAINLKFPNLKWTNEIVAVKQSISVLVSMFVGWAIAALFLGGHFLFGQYMYAEGYFAIALAVFLGAAAILWQWIKKRGVEIFESL